MIIGANNSQNQKKDSLEYMNFEATPSQEELKESFLKWIEDDSYIDSYKDIDIIKPGHVILRLYRYEQESSLLSVNEKKLKSVKILPYCKVVKVFDSSSGVNVGDILIAPDSLTKVITNVAWLQWNKIMKDERPTPENLPEPSMLSGKIMEWRENSKFVLNKVNPTDDDEYTFVRPITEFYTKIDRKKLIKSIK